MTRPLDAIEPPDCYARARQLADEIELIRKELGRPTDPRPPISVRGASPREVWFQALAVFRKADRLCHEIANDPTAAVPHAPPIDELRPGHVLQVIDATLRELGETRKALGITEEAAAPARDATKTPSDVLGVLANANRQINQLLERPFTPADVFQQVSFAIAYAARLTKAPPPAEPAFERYKRPADCFARLHGCLELARRIVSKAGRPVIEDITRPDPDTIRPADVYDMASLVLGEVAFLHALEPDRNPPYPFEGNVPGRKLPAHCYQLIGVLEQQLRQLAG
jgi:hypothetical protein